MIDREQVHLREIARLDAERLRTRQEVERLRGENVKLLDEIERLRLDLVRWKAIDVTVTRERDAVREQLAAMTAARDRRRASELEMLDLIGSRNMELAAKTAARDEACDLFVRKNRVDPVTQLEFVNRISALRKVGSHD